MARRKWIKMFCYNWLYGTLREELEPDERSVWADLLAMAGDSVVPGSICICDGIGYTPKQLSGLLKIELELYERTIAKLIKSYQGQIPKVSVDDNGIITINKFKEYQSDWDNKRDCPSQKKRKPTTPKNLPENLLENLPIKPTTPKNLPENLPSQVDVDVDVDVEGEEDLLTNKVSNIFNDVSVPENTTPHPKIQDFFLSLKEEWANYKGNIAPYWGTYSQLDREALEEIIEKSEGRFDLLRAKEIIREGFEIKDAKDITTMKYFHPAFNEEFVVRKKKSKKGFMGREVNQMTPEQMVKNIEEKQKRKECEKNGSTAIIGSNS